MHWLNEVQLFKCPTTENSGTAPTTVRVVMLNPSEIVFQNEEINLH